MAWRWHEIAEKRGVLLNYEAAVAGGIPVIKTMREALAGNSVSRVFGILNGTCNYILTRMEAEGISFDECLKDAAPGLCGGRPDLRHRRPRYRPQAVDPDQPGLRLPHLCGGYLHGRHLQHQPGRHPRGR